MTAQDSILQFKRFLETVMKNHPLALQADLIPEAADMNLLKARGALDPGAQWQWNQKQYDGKNYYSLLEGGIKVPLKIGPDLKFYYDHSGGVQLNPDASLPDEGLIRAGMELPLLQGLMIDRRRADLRKAKISLKLSESERQLELLELYLESSRAYWQWSEGHALLRVHEDMVARSRERFEAVKSSAMLEDRPMIDTLEAYIQWQNRTFAYLQARLQNINQTALLSVYLWDDSLRAVSLPAGIVPERPDLKGVTGPDSSRWLNAISGMDRHPLISTYRYKRDMLQVEQRLNKERFKPQLNVQYNWLTTPSVMVSGIPDLRNYKWGLQFYMPFFFRKERADFGITSIRLRDNELEREFKLEQQTYKLKAILNEWEMNNRQADVAEEIRKHAGLLLDAEKKLFFNGESSLFMVNQRETDYLNANIRFFETLTKVRMARIRTMYTAGLIEP